MNIEKVSRMVMVSTLDRSSTSQRKILISLPRVRWLERDPDYVRPETTAEELPVNTYEVDEEE